jgi:hypothetical protein
MNLKADPNRMPTGALPGTLEFLDERVRQSERVFQSILDGDFPGYCLVEKYWQDLECIIRQSGDLMGARKIHGPSWQEAVRRWREIQHNLSRFMVEGEIFEQRYTPRDQQMVSALELALVRGEKTDISGRILDLYENWLGRSGAEAGERLKFHEEVDYPDLIENMKKGHSHRRLPIKLGEGDLFCLVLKNEMDGFVAYVSNTAWNVLHEHSQTVFLERGRAERKSAIREVNAGAAASALAIKAALKAK